jgi:hypothetical protein
MHDFSTTRDAKEFLIGEIVDEAAREGVELREIERKMLYFSERGCTLPDILKVNEEFEREYDSDEYEQKIAGLIRGIKGRQGRTQNEMDRWNHAVLKLSDEDHYLSVLIDLASGAGSKSGFWNRWLPSLNSPGSHRPQGDFFRLILAAIALIAILLAVTVLRAKLFG